MDDFSALEKHTHNGKDSPRLQVAYTFMGSGAPSSTPQRIGYLYFDYTNGKVYGACGVSSSADWKILN